MLHEASNSTAVATRGVVRPTNSILYGPPGTGKTYRTAAEAVDLCDGKVPDDRNELMKRYRELIAAKRIAFVTFHQNYAYEDFVEGLRPVAGGEDDDEDEEESGGTAGGFSLRPEDGIFKQIANLARNNRGTPIAGSVLPLDRRQKVFKMSLGNSSARGDDRIYRDAIAGGYVFLRKGGDVDWSDAKYEDFDEILKEWQGRHPEATPFSWDIVEMWTFRANMQIGSLVVISDGSKKFRAIGEIAGPYEFKKGPDGNHRRKVKWLWHTENSLAIDLIYKERFSLHSACQLESKFIQWEALAQIVGSGADSDVSGAPEPFVLIIDEINRANVSKVFGELITLIEPDKRIGSVNELTVTLPYSKSVFGVPANLHIIGTMNTADRSIALLDTALRRRFRFEELMPDASLLRVVDGVNLERVLQGINERIEYLFDRDHQIGHAFFIGCSNRSDLDAAMREKVIPLLVEYFYEDWEKVRAVLGESADDGAFVHRRRLRPPPGTDIEEAGERWRYTVQPAFAPSAYTQLIQ